MDNGNTLDDILGEEQPTEAAPQPETIGPKRDEQGRFASKEPGDQAAEAPQPEAPPASEQSAPENVPFAALKDERAKRQELERRLQEYEAFFEQARNAQAQPQAVDPEADPIAYVTAQVQQALLPQVQQQQLQTRVEVTEVLARQKWADYDEKVELFKEEAVKNPFLVREVMQAANPAEYAYNVASQIAQARQYGGQTPTREQIEAELREKIMAEIGMPQRQAPLSTANERSVAGRGGPAWSGPTPLDDILS